MTVELKIRWDGDVPGLDHHRLSLSAFGEPLRQLLATLRRIASNQIVQAADPDRGRSGGRLHHAAEALDLEIESLEPGCVTLSMICKTATEPPGPNLELFDTVAENAVHEFLEGIEAEQGGRLRNGMVRRFLGALPVGVRVQEYALWVNGASRRQVTVGAVTLHDVAQELPGLAHIVGRVVGVGFEPGRLEVRFKSEGPDTRTLACQATEQQVEAALALRHETVRALVVEGERARLLWIRSISAPQPDPTPSERRHWILTRWDALLRRLAE